MSNENTNEAMKRWVLVVNEAMTLVGAWLKHENQLIDFGSTNFLLGVLFSKHSELTERERHMVEGAVHISVVRLWQMEEEDALPENFQKNTVQ